MSIAPALNAVISGWACAGLARWVAGEGTLFVVLASTLAGAVTVGALGVAELPPLTERAWGAEDSVTGVSLVLEEVDVTVDVV